MYVIKEVGEAFHMLIHFPGPGKARTQSRSATWLAQPQVLEAIPAAFQGVRWQEAAIRSRARAHTHPPHCKMGVL